jgi:hypothetical protein
MALRVLVDELKKGRKVVIFPEGRLTVTGALMKVYEGPGAIAQMAGARVLPVRIDGALYTPFSRMRGKLRLRWFPKITITFLPPVKFNAPEGLKGAALRQHQANKLYDVMADMVFRTSAVDRTLFQSLLDARHIHGGGHKVVEDIARNPTSFDKLVMGSFILGRRMAEMTPGQKNVAVLLPNSIGCLLTIFGLHAFGWKTRELRLQMAAEPVELFARVHLHRVASPRADVSRRVSPRCGIGAIDDGVRLLGGDGLRNRQELRTRIELEDFPGERAEELEDAVLGPLMLAECFEIDEDVRAAAPRCPVKKPVGVFLGRQRPVRPRPKRETERDVVAERGVAEQHTEVGHPRSRVHVFG